MEIKRVRWLSLSVGLTFSVVGMDISGDRALIDAVKKGDRQAVRLLIAAKVDLNKTDTYGNTALIWAASEDKEGIVYDLVDAGAAINLRNSSGNTALIAALYGRSSGAAKKLIATGADLTSNHAQARAALSVAISERHIHLAHILIDTGRARVNDQDSVGNTALMYAACLGNKRLMRALIDAGSMVTMANHRGRTALSMVDANGGLKIAEVLIAAGAPFDRQMDHYNYFVQFTRELFKAAKTCFPTKTQGAKAYQHLKDAMDVIRLFAHEHIFVDMVDDQGNTLLHYAVLAGNRPMVALLLYLMAQAHRAESIVTRNAMGYTPLDIAVLKSPYWILPVLGKIAR